MKKLILTIALLASSCFAIVTNINSGATHEVIGKAVDAADSGDTLLVSTGVYQYVSMDIDDKNLIIIGGYAIDFSSQVSYDDTVLEAQNYCVSFSHSTSTMERLTFTGALTGMDVFDYSLVTTRYCYIKENVSYFPGAGVYVHGNGTLVLERSYIENNSATNTVGINGNGGGAFVFGTGKLIVSERSSIVNNFAAEKGGGVYINGAYVEVKDSSQISANTSGDDGGGVYMNGGTLLVHDKADIGYQSLNPNMANGNGGGIYAYNNASITFKDQGTFLYNNYAEQRGGGAYLLDSSITFYDNAGIGLAAFACSNSAGLYGGGIYADDSIIVITNAVINNCSAQYGAAIQSSDTDIILYSCEIGNTNDNYTNVAELDGGGLYTLGGTCMVNQTTFINNQADYDGGAMGFLYSEVTITNSVLKKNKADGDGGAIHSDFDSIVNISDSDILSNASGETGGGLFATGDSKVKFIGCNIGLNYADSKGGGIYVEDGADVEIISNNENTYIYDNIARYGGGIYVIDDGSSVDIVATSGYKVAISYNSAEIGGGALYANTSSKIMILGDVSFSHCDADYGGGIAVITKASATLKKINGYQPKVEDCTANINGGGIYVVATDTLAVCDGVVFNGNFSAGITEDLVNGNNQVLADGGNKGGGAVAVYSEAEFRAVDCVFEENNTLADGGAIAVIGATAIIGSNVIEGAGTPITKSVFIKNMATNSGYGGAVYVDHGVAELYNIAIISNRSSRGGGVYATYSDAYLSDVLIAKNYSSINGGGDGVALFNATAAMNNCTVVNNDDEGVTVSSGGTVAMTNCIVWGHSDYQVITNPVQTVVYSDIEGGYPGVGNINSHPHFLNSSALDYQLAESSPCIDAGTNLPWMDPPTTDLAGNERIYDGTVDMGCYELVPEPGMGICIFGIFILFFGKIKLKL